MQTPEGKVKAAVKKLLDERGAYYFMPVKRTMGKKTLDFLVCYRGRFLAIETKAGKPEPTKLQAITIDEISAADGWAFCTNDVRHVRVRLDQIDYSLDRK